MPAKSNAQQQADGAVLGAKRGDKAKSELRGISMKSCYSSKPVV